MTKKERRPQQAVGGQAVIEGVLMKTPHGIAIAVRDPEGGIVVKDRPWRSLTQRIRPLGWPFVRGIIILFESLKEGFEGLQFSAETAIEEERDKKKESDKGGKGLMERVFPSLSLALGVIIAIALFKVLPHGAALGAGFRETDTLFYVVEGLVKLTIVIGYIALISRMKDIQRVFMYHGAEHKSIRAFEEGAKLDVAQTVPYSRLHERCGTSFIIVVVIASIFVYMGASIFLPKDLEGGFALQAILVVAKIVLLVVVVAPVAYEVNRWAGKHWKSSIAHLVAWPGLMIQKLLTTKEPTEDQLEVALVSLRASLAFSPDAAGSGSEKQPWRLRRFESFQSFLEEEKAGGRDPSDREEAA